MIGKKTIACVIPARLASMRFPRKILSNLGDKPLLQWAWEGATSIPFFDEVLFAIDSKETAEVIQKFGGKFIMTSEKCPSGTDRLCEVLAKGDVKSDIWVNWQADEPFITQEMIEELLQSCEEEGSDLWTLKKKIINKDERSSMQFAKVVCDSKGFAMYFSRSPIPAYRDPGKEEETFKHIGIYAYTKEALKKIASLKPHPLEEAEKLEQLRFLANGLKILVHETNQEVVGIDLPEHLEKAEAYLSMRA